MGVEFKKAINIINSLKNGVVPDMELNFLCVGRDSEIKEFERCLELTGDNGSAVKFINGSYGVGKSFLLNVVGQKALKENFIVSNIRIDKNFKFNRGEDIYYQVMHNLKINNAKSKGTSFEEIFDLWIKELRRDRANALTNMNNVIATINDFNGSFAMAFGSYVRAKINKDMDMSNVVSAWLKGEKNIAASIKSKFNVKSNIDRTNYMSFLRAMITLFKLLGYRGLVILVDELELIINERSNIRETVYENIRNIIDMSASGELCNCMLIFTGTNELFENEERGIKTYAALYKRIASSYDNENLDFRDLRQPVIKIKGLNKENLIKLTKNIISVHSIAYNWTPLIHDEVIDRYGEIACSRFGGRITEANTREYSKKVIDALDIMEQNPEIDMFKNEINIISEYDNKQEEQKNESTILDSITNDPFFEDNIIKFD